MMDVISMLAALVGGYLLGSIPVAWILARIVTGKDLRQLGSGNVGVLNTALSVARWAGVLVFLTEAAKGALAVVLGNALGGGGILVGLSVIAAVAGTRWNIWLRGAGGRGNTAGMAALLIIHPLALALGLAAWFLIRFIGRSSFLATRIVLLGYPVLLGWITRDLWFALCAAVLCAFYLSTQRPETDDHLLLKERWPSLWAFLTGPPRG